MDELQRIEGHLDSILAALHKTDQQHLTNLSTEERRRELARMVIAELNQLLGGAAMSLDATSLTAEQRAENALAHRMGSYVSPERR